MRSRLKKIIRRRTKNSSDIKPLQHQGPPWKILVVDDEPDIHTLTKISMTHVLFDQRPLAFVSAFSAKEARELLEKNETDFAVALIDVVMETKDAGLELVNYIRKTLKNTNIRIIIRTGQPGIAPERQVIEHYDIDDYKEKTELTTQKLFTGIRCALKAYRDMMDLQGKSEQLARAERLTSIGTMLAGICHEIKNPNSFISGNVAFLRDFLTLAYPVLEQHATDDSSGRLTRFLDQMLPSLDGIDKGSKQIDCLVKTLQRHVRGSISNNKTSFFLHESCDDALTILSFRLKQGVQLDVGMPAEIKILGDRQKLAQVFINLIANALDAMNTMHTNDTPSVGKKLSIHGYQENNQIQVKVQDNGPGIRTDHCEKVFDAFFSTKKQDLGLGMGLSIVREIIPDHEGSISVQLPDEGGTVFVMQLPM